MNNKVYLCWSAISIVSCLVSVWFISINTGSKSLAMGLIMLSCSVALCVATYLGKPTTSHSIKKRPSRPKIPTQKVSLTIFDSTRLKIICAFTLFLVIFIGYVTAGPYLTISRLKSAIVEKDAERISNNIDFPVLRQNLNAQFNKTMFDSASSELAGNPFAGIAVALSTQLVDGMINSFMTPEGLATLIGGINKSKNNKTEQNRLKNSQIFKEATFSYEGISIFSVSIPVENDENVKIILKRKGLTWKVVDILFSMDLFNIPDESNEVEVSKHDYKTQEAFSRMDSHSTTLKGLVSRCQTAIELDINVQEKCKDWKKVASA